MKITEKIIITDTNIITDLDTMEVLEDFVNLDNVYISDLVKRDEINYKTGNINIINKFKVINSNEEELIKMVELAKKERKLSMYDIINYIIARDNNGILATGDNKLKQFSEKNGVKVIRTLMIIKLLESNNIITKDKATRALYLLKNNKNNRIPIKDIDKLIKEYEDSLEFN